MERKNYTQKEVMMILQELTDGLSVEEAIKRYKVSKATLYRWRKRAQRTDIAEINRLKLVDEENKRLKHLLAEAALEIQALKERIKEFE